MNLGGENVPGSESGSRSSSSLSVLPTMPIAPHYSANNSSQLHAWRPTGNMNLESSDSSSDSRLYGFGHLSSTGWSSEDTSWSNGRGSNNFATPWHAIQRENQQLIKQVSAWQAKFETLQGAYNLLLSRVSPLPNSRPEITQLKPEDYPNIKFWYRHQWMSVIDDRVTDIKDMNIKEDDIEEEEFDADADFETQDVKSLRGQSRSRAGINVSMRYVQHQDGQVIDGHRAREIRIHARAVFVGFAREGKVFSSWGDTDAVSRMEFYNHMYTRFQEIQYCDLDWKAEQVAIDTFPGWKVTWTKKQKKALKKQSDGLEQGLKRARQGSGSGVNIPSSTKKPKSAEDVLWSTDSLEIVKHSDELQPSIPQIKVTPNTPARPLWTMTPLTTQEPALRPLAINSLHSVGHTFPINTPFLGNETFIPPFMPTYPPETGNGAQVVPEQVDIRQATLKPTATNPLDAAATKRTRTKANKMRPTKNSTTPRNLCAQQWVLSNPKGTTEEFSVYYDGLSADERQVWEQLSAEKTAKAT